MADRLNDKQSRFVEEYLVDLNATQAAIRAGYSEKTAGSQGFDLLKKPEIQEAVQKAMADRSKRTQITQERVLEEYAKIAFLDPRRLYQSNGSLIPLQELDGDVAAAIGGLDVVTMGVDLDGNAVVTKKIKLIDKKGALDSIARHLGMFTEKLELSGKVEMPERPQLTKEEWLKAHGMESTGR